MENEEMEKYGMVIINEKTTIEKSIRFHPIFMAEIPVFSNMAIGLFCPVLFVMFPGRNLMAGNFPIVRHEFPQRQTPCNNRPSASLSVTVPLISSTPGREANQAATWRIQKSCVP